MTTADLSTSNLEDVPLAAVRTYLERSGWSLLDEDDRTSMWRQQARDRDLRVVLPARRDVADYGSRLIDALRTMAYAERRAAHEVFVDLALGGADTVSVRLVPDAPPGEAPLGLAQSAVTALRDYVVGSAAALQVPEFVLPARRPARAEMYAARARLSTAPGSFVLNLSLPLSDDDERPAPGIEPEQPTLLNVPPHPYGRRVVERMRSVAETSVTLAQAVGLGDQPLRSFGAQRPNAANATELSALAALGGPEQIRYHLRFSESPLAASPRGPLRLPVTPAEQRVLEDAADFLRTRQPRSGVTIAGLVVRLFRTSAFGPGEVVIQGADDDFGVQRRYRLNLGESDYNQALRAHEAGLQVIAAGDVQTAGTRLTLVRVTSFSILPGLDD